MLDKYFDYNSSTPVDKRIIEFLLLFIQKNIGNSSSFHLYGQNLLKQLTNIKKYISNKINCESDCIIFTSGATESNNIILQGIINFYTKYSYKNHIICPIQEHESVLNIIKYYEKKGEIEVTWLNNRTACYNDFDFIPFIKKNTLLIICMHVNNEIGAINDIYSIGKLCNSKKIFFHVDAAQSYGKISIDIKKCFITSLSASGGKIYSLKGVGIMYLMKKPIRVRLLYNSFGGSQQGLRSGTIPIELCYSFFLASKFCYKEMKKETKRLRFLQLYIHIKLSKMLKENINLNGPIDSRRIYNNLNYSFYGVEGEAMVLMMKHIVSTGSACSSSSLTPSIIIESVSGLEAAQSSIRISFGRFTKKIDCIALCNDIYKTFKILKKRSPFY